MLTLLHKENVGGLSIHLLTECPARREPREAVEHSAKTMSGFRTLYKNSYCDCGGGTMKKRLFPILLAIVMSFSLLPVSAMAASSTDLDADVPELARLGDTYIQRRTPQQNEQGGVKNSTISAPVQNYSLVANEPGT